MAQINKPTDYFKAVAYSGNGTDNSATQSVNMGLQPDLCWIKNRNLTGASNQAHHLFDSVRGGNIRLMTDFTSAESDKSDRFDGITSTGFDLVQDDAGTNRSDGTYVAWGWKANGSGSSNTDGSITSTVSANTTAGFSIVSYTGTGSAATVGHGLGVAPSVIINKCRSAGQNWATYHSSLGGTKALFLDGTNGETTSSSYFNNTDPTSSVFSVGNSGDTNLSSGTHISYCFAEKKGYSKFGKLQAIGENSNVFVYTGFKPAFVIIKANVTDAWANWYMFDNARDPYNLTELALYTNLSKADDEYGGSNYSQIDMLSNGFKIRRDGNWGVGGAGQTSIYMAFAEQPLVGTNNIPATAK